ncbi:hypothetical protein [Pseudomonas sp.]|uniref:hypothetical protein n=1 Tax=Pseudomonas sp. TaxID=306 RepID=UPI003561A61B
MHTLSKASGKNLALTRGAYLLLVLIASYGVIWALTGCAGGALFRLGLARSEAVIFSSLLGFLLYPVIAITALAVRRPLRFWVVLALVSALLAMLGRSWGAR